jgi:predicted ribosomally synthesized peptide with SipW-like signal peptide
MEKRNTILLTVIAVATLLVAVVGATFAYFTATVNTTNDSNATTTVTTKVLASAVMDFGSDASKTGVLPGYNGVKTLKITGACKDSTNGCQDVNTTITVTPDIDSSFGSSVTWKLYKSSTAITCTSNPVTTGGTYYDNGSCTIPEGATVVLSGSTAVMTKDVTVTSTTNDSYYLVVSYANDENAAQDTQQGKTYSVTLGFAAKSNS